AVFHGSSGAAARLEEPGQRGDRLLALLEPRDEGHGFPRAARRAPRHPHALRGLRRCFRFRARAAFERPSAFRTTGNAARPPGTRRVDEPFYAGISPTLRK